MRRNLNEFYIRYSTDELTRLQDQISTLRNKLDPANPNPADAHLSIEEKYRTRETLDHVLIHIKMLRTEVQKPTGDHPKHIIGKFYRHK
jgi:hypothetical protein